jgi:hypothetical protein
MNKHHHVVSLASRAGSTGALLTVSLPNFVASVQSFFQNMVKSSPDFHVIEQKLFSQKLTAAKMQYTDMAKISLYVPSGMSVSYLDWLKVLEDAAETTLTLESRVLDPFLAWVGLLTSDDSRFINRRVKDGLGDIEFSDLDRLKGAIAECFSRRVKDERPYGELLGRNKDWDTVVKESNLLTERTARIRPNVIHEKTQQLSHYLETLAGHLSDPDTVDKFNNEYGKLFNRDIVSTLADMTYQVAQEVEFFSVYVYYLESTAQAIEDSMVKIQKIAKI